MPVNEYRAVENLRLDLTNPRTVNQPDEIHAVKAMISISPVKFWGLLQSLVADGYHATENIVLLQDSADNLIVKEGNRRVACLKLIFGFLDPSEFDIPTDAKKLIQSVSSDWKDENTEIPCSIYPVAQAAKVDKIVALAHGKAQEAGKDKWSSVATARHSRNVLMKPQPPLDLLEKYLVDGQNHSASQAKRWSGDYPLTILEDVMKRAHAEFGATSPKNLADLYPKVIQRDALERILLDIGTEALKTQMVRNPEHLKPYLPSATAGAATGGTPPPTAPTGGPQPPVGGAPSGAGAAPAGGGGGGTKGTSGGTVTTPSAPPAAPIENQQAVKNILKGFKPVGNGRHKVTSLRLEALSINIEKAPVAFCFLLRSMFEISAKAYVDDHSAVAGGPQLKDAKGNDKRLSVLLTDICQHIHKNGKDKARLQLVHGAGVEIAKADSILSVTSMNQMVHSPSFNAVPKDVCRTFSNIFPLLKEMNS